MEIAGSRDRARPTDPRELIKWAARRGAPKELQRIEGVAPRGRAERFNAALETMLSDEELAMIGDLGAGHDELEQPWTVGFDDALSSRPDGKTALAGWPRQSARQGGHDAMPIIQRAALDGLPIDREAKRRRIREALDRLSDMTFAQAHDSRAGGPSPDDEVWRRLADEALFQRWPSTGLAGPVDVHLAESRDPAGTFCCSCGEPCLYPDPCPSGGARCSACVSGLARCFGCGCEAQPDCADELMNGRDEGGGARRRESGSAKACGCELVVGSDEDTETPRSGNTGSSAGGLRGKPFAMSQGRRWFSRFALALLIIALVLFSAFGLDAA